MEPCKPDACAVSIEIDGRQRYLLETDKLREMLGASIIMAGTVTEAENLFAAENGLYLFSPVSGEIKAWAPREKRGALLSAAWKLRCWLADRGVEHTCGYLETYSCHFLTQREKHRERAMGPTPDPGASGKPDLRWVHGKLAERVRARKDAKSGPDPRPRCSLFAECRIHPGEVANLWQPGAAVHPELMDARRGQVSWRAKAKLEAWQQTKNEDFYWRHLRGPVIDRLGGEVDEGELRRCFTFSDLQLAEPGEDKDQYLAFICADGDDMGKLLAGLDWNIDGWGKGAPWQLNAEFSRAFNSCVQTAYHQAVADIVPLDKVGKTLENKGRGRIVLPILPQLLGGDDLWTVCRRDVAFDFASSFAARFAEKVKGDEMMRKALELARSSSQPSEQAPAINLTVSMGVAFAKASYPVAHMIEQAEELMVNAKSLRKGQVLGRSADGKACVDWHRVISSTLESVESARKQGWGYQAEGVTIRLTTRPWSIEDAEKFVKAAKCFRAIPGRKRKQLDQLLRRGPTLGLLAWEGWWQGLGPEQRAALGEANKALPEAYHLPSVEAGESHPQRFALAPWRRKRGGLLITTPLLDLLDMDDILARVAGSHGEVPRG